METATKSSSNKAGKWTNRFGTACTIAYAIYFPFSFGFVFLLPAVIELPNFSWNGTVPTIMLIALTFPLSLGISIYYIWKYHALGDYKKSLLACTLPWLVYYSLILFPKLLCLLFN